MKIKDYEKPTITYTSAQISEQYPVAVGNAVALASAAVGAALYASANAQKK